MKEETSFKTLFVLFSVKESIMPLGHSEKRKNITLMLLN